MNRFDEYRKKTFTPFWNNFNTKPKKSPTISFFFKSIKKILKKFIGIKIKIESYKNLKLKDETFISYQISDSIINYRNNLIVDELIKYLNKIKIKFKKNDIKIYVEDYCRIFKNTPIYDMGSGFGFNEGLFLFCIIKTLKPTLVIESGIMKGFTTYLIDAATNKNCKILCYDISFENIEYRSRKAAYFKYDINENPPNLKNQKVLAFWDDHTSQLERLKFSIKNKIKFNIFDDDLSFLNFHSDGWPPIPSINMLFELKKNIIKDDTVGWISRGRKGEIWLKKIKYKEAIKNINEHKIFPNLFSITGYQNHSQCSFVKLK